MEQTKQCKKCEEVKPLSLFSKKSVNRDGYQHACKACYSIWHKAHYVKTWDEKLEKVSARYSEKSEAIKKYSRYWRVVNKDKVADYCDKNRPKLRAKSMRRYGNVKRATPIWFSTFDEFVIDNAYEIAHKRTLATGIMWHLDHIYPINAKTVSGLHCAANLQVIPAVLNMRKRNSLELLSVGEWIQHT